MSKSNPYGSNTEGFADVTQLVDTDKPLKVKVKKANVDDALCRVPGYCAIALALKDDPSILDGRVGATVAYVVYKDEPDTAYRFTVRGLTQQMVKAFDGTGTYGEKGAFFAPGSYELAAPTPSQQLGAWADRQYGRSANPRPRAYTMPLRHIGLS